MYVHALRANASAVAQELVAQGELHGLLHDGRHLAVLNPLSTGQRGPGTGPRRLAGLHLGRLGHGAARAWLREGPGLGEHPERAQTRFEVRGRFASRAKWGEAGKRGKGGAAVRSK